jgi:HEAT repeat protein
MTTELSILIASLTASDADSRSRAASQLAARLGRDARPAVMALVRACGDEAEDVRQWATAALEEMGPPETCDVDRLVALLEDDSPDVAYWAATLLGRLKGDAAPAVDALAHAVAAAPHLSVRQRSAWALGEIGPAAAAALPVLQAAATDPDPRLARLARTAIVRASCQLGP